MGNIYKTLKIALSKAERDEQERRMIEEVIRQIGSSVYTESEILELTENKGILVAKDSGKWYFWNEKLTTPKKYELGGTFEDTAAINELKTSIQELINKESTVADPDTIAVRGADGTLLAKNNKEPIDDELITAKYLAQLLSEKVDVRVDIIGNGVTQPDAKFILANYSDYSGSLIQFYKNSTGQNELISYGFILCSLDGSQKSLIEIDRDGIITKWTEETNYRVGAEQERGVNYTPINAHKIKLLPAQMKNAKGLRVWIEFEYQKNPICQYVEMRFSDKINTDIYIGIPLPEPNAFASPMAVQYFRKTQQVLVPSEVDPSGKVTKEEGLLEIVRADKKPTPDNIKIKDVRAIF